MKVRSLVGLAVGLTVAFAARGEQVAPLAVAPKTSTPSGMLTPVFGTSALTYVRLTGAIDFTAPHSTSAWEIDGVIRRYGDNGLTAAVRPPDGSILEYLQFDYCDTNPEPDFDLYFDFGQCDRFGNNCTLLMPTLYSTGAEGCASRVYSTLSVPIDNVDKVYVLSVGGAYDSSRQFAGALLGYRLRVSPPPASATFTDVPASHPYFRHIEALFDSGVTAGCDAAPPMFCPERAITRGEMAVFVARALGLSWP